MVTREDRGYRLTPKGQRLRTLMEELSLWSTEHDARPPRPGETIVPEHDMWALEVYLNRNGPRLAKPVTWVVRLEDDGPHTRRFDGEHWSWQRGDADADVVLTTTARAWSTLLFATQTGARTPPAGYALEGKPARVREFRRLFLMG